MRAGRADRIPLWTNPGCGGLLGGLLTQRRDIAVPEGVKSGPPSCALRAKIADKGLRMYSRVLSDVLDSFEETDSRRFADICIAIRV